MAETQEPNSQENAFSNAKALTHILETDTPYVEAAEKRISPTGTAGLTGEAMVAECDRLRNDEVYRQEQGLTPEAAEKQIEKKFSDLRQLLIHVVSSDHLGVEEARQHTLDCLKALPAYSEKYGNPGDNAAEALGKITDSRVTEEFTREHIRRNKEAFEGKREIIDQISREFRKTILASSQQADGIIPAFAYDRIAQRFEETKVEPMDVYQKTYASAPGQEVLGWHDQKTGVIRVLPDVPDGRLQRALVHEYFHAISGRTIQHEDGSGDIRTQRSGLQITGREDGPTRFTWLNEAITEYLNMYFLNDDLSFSYIHEREALLELTKEVPMKLFINAYFEEYRNVRGEKIPHWKALTTELNQLEPGLLTRLDKQVADRGPSCLTSEINRIS